MVQQEAAIKKALEPKDKPKDISDPDREAALELLRDRQLLDRILEDFGRAGIVGEETNKLIGYLAAVSRKLDAPLGVVIQSSSAAGKSSLMDAILSLMLFIFLCARHPLDPPEVRREGHRGVLAPWEDPLTRCRAPPTWDEFFFDRV